MDWKKTNIKPLSEVDPLFKKSSIEPIKQSEGKNISVGTVFKTSTGVHLSQKDRQNHMHVIGSTGTGKSKFLELLLRQDIKDKKCGLCLIDPHGSLYDDIVLYIAQHYPRLAERIILFNPAGDTENVVGFNPIPYDTSYHSYALFVLIDACLKAWGQNESKNTPRIRTWLYNIFYPIVVNKLTLVETAPFLNIRSKSYREALLRSVGSEMVTGDWIDFEGGSHMTKQTTIEGAANRLRAFLQDPLIRNVIGQKEKVLNFHNMMEEGKVLLVNLNGQGKISRENTKLLGIMLVNEIFRAAIQRNYRDPALKPFYLYIDEFGQLVTQDIASALEECRKFKLFLILAHQHLAQLKREDENLYASVITDCKNKVVFGSLSYEDAEIMMNEISTGFLNTKKVKDEIRATKVRHIEETRLVRGISRSETKGDSLAQSKSHSESHGTTSGVTHIKGTSITDTEGETLMKGTSKSWEKSTSKGITEGYSDMYGETENESFTISRGETDNQSHTNSRSRTSNQSHSTSRSHSENESKGKSTSHTNSQSSTSSQSSTEGSSKSSTDGKGTSEGTTRNYDSYGTGDELNRSYGDNSSSSKARSTGNSESRTAALSDTKGQSSSEARSFIKGRSDTDGYSDIDGKSYALSSSDTTGHGNSKVKSKSTGRSRSTSHSDIFTKNFSETESIGGSINQSESVNQSRAIGKQESKADSQSTSKNFGTSHGQTDTRSHSTTNGGSISEVPFLRPEEYQETISRTFWSLEELKHIQIGEIKNQDVAEAFIKIGANKPIKTKIKEVKTSYYNKRFTPKKIENLKIKVLEANSQYYTPIESVRDEYYRRHKAFFGEPLQFDEEPLKPLAASQDTSGVIDIEAGSVEDPFES